MRLEIRDPDFIWSSAKLIDLQKRGGKNIVTIRYDGWGDEWDELLEYPNVRLARLYTYTKEVRCWVDIMTKKKRKAPPKKDGKHWCTIWPCRVKFRMPHPVGDQIRRSKELLRVETNVFCVPYGQELLPNYIQQSILNGGRWINVRRLRQWKTDDLGAQLESEKKNFDQAMNVCLADNGKFGFLPKGAVDNGSLLRDEFRVKTVGGEPVGGVMYCGDFTPVVFHITKKPAPKPPQNESPPNSKDSPIRVEQAEVRIFNILLQPYNIHILRITSKAPVWLTKVKFTLLVNLVYTLTFVRLLHIDVAPLAKVCATRVSTATVLSQSHSDRRASLSMQRHQTMQKDK
jgi:hypothetical protein